MDLIIELIKAIVAAFEESKEKKRVQTSTPLPAPQADGEREALAEVHRRIAEKQEILRRQRDEAQARAAAEVQAQAQAHRAAKTQESPRVSRPMSSAQRMARLLRQPSTTRELIVLGELLGPPKCLRRGRH